MKDLKAVRKPSTKEQVERMYKIAYYLDRSFLTPTDVVSLGLDVYRLKEFGQVRMKQSWARIRPQVDAIWARTTGPMRAMFWFSYYCEALDYLQLLLDDMEPVVRNVSLEKKSLETLSSSMCQKLPAELQQKIKEGFGREWGNE